MRKFAICMVVYYPSESLFERLRESIDLGFEVYLFDNSPEVLLPPDIVKNPRVMYVTAGKNVGLGLSISVLCATACGQGSKYALFLDQDTVISGRTLEFIERADFYELFESNRKFSAVVFDGKSSRFKGVLEVDFAINSGSLFSLEVLSKIGWHNSDYFVDCVDYEFCLRSRHFGYRIGKIFNTTDFNHSTEQGDYEFVIFGKSLKLRRYSPLRRKDAIRAYVRLALYCLSNRDCSGFVSICRSFFIYVLGQTLSTILLSNSNQTGLVELKNEQY